MSSLDMNLEDFYTRRFQGFYDIMEKSEFGKKIEENSCEISAHFFSQHYFR